MTTYDAEWIMIRAAAITGTRSTGHRDLDGYAELFTSYLARFADAETRFYIGGAKGIDSLSLLRLARNTRAHITIVVPGTVRQQPAEAQQAITRSRDRITEVVELRAAELGSPAFHARNRWMVDRSHMVIGLPLLGPQGRSGTWQTLNYGAEQGKPQLIVPEASPLLAWPLLASQPSASSSYIPDTGRPGDATRRGDPFSTIHAATRQKTTDIHG